MHAKKLAGERAANYVKSGMIVGLGTGSTAYWTIQKIGELVKQGLRIQAIATSNKSEELAKQLDIPLISFSETDHLDLTFDGADEVDENKFLIKGGGGALLREKIIANASDKYIIVADESKLVKVLGKFPLPVEINPFGWQVTLKHLQQLGCIPSLRKNSGKIFVTDNGNYISDCAFEKIRDPESVCKAINMIPGVVENGIFLRRPEKVIIGYADGSVIEI